MADGEGDGVYVRGACEVGRCFAPKHSPGLSKEENTLNVQRMSPAKSACSLSLSCAQMRDASEAAAATRCKARCGCNDSALYLVHTAQLVQALDAQGGDGAGARSE
jgi:hypothetical protein